MARTQRRATYEELLKLPENMVGEIIDGELIATPRPALPHARASSAIGADLFGPFDRLPGKPDDPPGGWWIIDEPELHLGQEVIVPDLAGWRRERMPKVPNAPAVELPPDWVCEVVSPSTERVDRARKMAVYGRVRVPHLWLVNPLLQTLEVYRLDGDVWTLLATLEGDTRARVVPFDAVELDLSRWWIESEMPGAGE